MLLLLLLLPLAFCCCCCCFGPALPCFPRSSRDIPIPVQASSTSHCLPLAGRSLSFCSALRPSSILLLCYLPTIHRTKHLLLRLPSSSSSSLSFHPPPVSVRPHPVSPALNPASAPLETIAFVELANLPWVPQRRSLQRCPYCKQCVSALIASILRSGDGDVRIGSALSLRKAQHHHHYPQSPFPHATRPHLDAAPAAVHQFF